MRIEYTEYGSGDGWVLLIHGRSVETKNQSPGPMAATIHGIFFGRIAPPTGLRKQIQAPAMVVGHPRDPIHPWADAAMLAEEMPAAHFVEAKGILEWRRTPARLNAEATSFVADCWGNPTSAAMRVPSERQ